MSNVKNLDLKELLEVGIKSEIEAQEVYEDLNKLDLPFVLKNKFKFLKGEEEDHERVLRSFFDEFFPDQKPILPEESLKPSPKVDPSNKGKVSDILKQAMESEKDSRRFYKELGNNFEKREKVKIANYLAYMEKGHYEVLKSELEGIRELENFDELNEFVAEGL